MRNLFRVAYVSALVLTALNLGAVTVSAQGPISQDSPLLAITVGNPVPRISAHAAQWVRFDYSFTPDQKPRPRVTVRLLDGVLTGLGFQVWSPERMQGDWRDNEPVGRGAQEIIAGCTQTLPDNSKVKCTTNDLFWVGGFGAPGVYYVRIVNNSDSAVAPQLIVSGPGLGQCVNPSGTATPSPSQVQEGIEGFATAQCEFPPLPPSVTATQTLVTPTSATTPTGTVTPTPGAPASPTAPTSTPTATAIPAVTATPTPGAPASPTAPTSTPTATAIPAVTAAPAVTLTPGAPASAAVPTATPAATLTRVVTPTIAATATPVAVASPSATPAPVPTTTVTVPAPPGTARNQATVEITINDAGELTIGGLSMKALGVGPIDSQATQMAKKLGSAHIVIQGDVVTVDVHGMPVLKMQWTPASRQVVADLAAQYGYQLRPETLSRLEEWISSSSFDITARYTNEVSKPMVLNLTKPIWVDVGPEGQLTVETIPLALTMDPIVFQTIKQSGVKNAVLCWDKGTFTARLDGVNLPSITLDSRGVRLLGQTLGLPFENGVDPFFGDRVGFDVNLPGGAHQKDITCGN